MSRNGSGTYSVVNTFVAGTTITASTHNANWSDIGAEITNSVAVDGQSTMTGALKAASGTVALPGITFGADTDSGLYRIGANNLGVAVNGAKVIDVATTGAAVTGTLAATGAISQNGFALLPVGMGPLPWCGVAAPSGWVLAGATYSRTTYASLWAFAEAQIALGNTFFTNGDGSTTFTIATMDGYVPAGVDATAARIASFTAVGATAGAATVALSQANLPNVNFTVASGQTVSVTGILSRSGGTNGAGSTGISVNTANSVESLTMASTGTVTNTGTAASGGSDTAHANVQPSRAFNFIIFAGV